MNEPNNMAAAGRGMLWAVTGAALTLAGVVVFGLPRQQASAPQAVAPAPAAAPAASDASEQLRARLNALEQEVAADRKRLAEATQKTETERQRLQEERARLAAAPSTPVQKPRITTPPPPRVATAPSTAKAAPPPAPVKIIEPPVAQTPLAAAPAPQPASVQPRAAPSTAEQRAGAERLLAQGNYSEAAVMFRQLATQGDGDSQLRLGEMYFRGQGVPQNNFQAYVWYNAAVRSGNSAARAPQERVAALLQPVEVEQADKLSRSVVRPQKGR